MVTLLLACDYVSSVGGRDAFDFGPRLEPMIKVTVLLQHRASLLLLLVLVIGSLSVITFMPPVRGAGETYSLASIPVRVQESNTPGVLSVLNVSNAATGTTYAFTWHVTDPTGTMHNANNSTMASQSSFLLSAAYPSKFGTNINYVGNYTVSVDETGPVKLTAVATAQFQVGLTDKTNYQRTFPVSILARGYNNNDNITINLSQGGLSMAGFPAWQLASSTGTVSRTFVIPSSVAPGAYLLSLTGKTTPVKNPLDTQSFTVYPTNATVAQFTSTPAVLERSQTELMSFTATYLSGLPIGTGSATVVFADPGGSVFYSTASYDSTGGDFDSAYRIPTNGQLGIWTATMNINSFNDGYGNGGVGGSLSTSFTVQRASLQVSVLLPNRTYTIGDVIPIYATITYPDGGFLSTGTVTASVSNTNGQTASQLGLTYVQGQGRWVGAYVVGAGDTSGILVAQVSASDPSGNSGSGGGSAVLNAPAATSSLNLYYFILAAAAFASGATAGVLLRKPGTSSKPFEDFFKLAGGDLGPSAVIVAGDAGSGTTTVGLQLLNYQLGLGRPCGLLAYDMSALEAQKRVTDMGRDVSKDVQEGKLQILDCRPALAGVGWSTENPLDFREMSVKVTQMIDAAKAPITILLDSFSTVFKSAPPNVAANLLRVLATLVKNSKGTFVLSGEMKSVPSDVMSRLDAVIDGVVELGMVKSVDSTIRTLSVRKMMGRRISHQPVEFEIVSGKGVRFQGAKIPAFLRRVNPRMWSRRKTPVTQTS